MRRSLHLFDLDDTLMTTAAKVWVRQEITGYSHALTPAQFTTYSLQEGEVFDFREFSDVGILSRGIVVEYTREIIGQITGRGTKSHFGILTARGDKTLHAPFLIRLFRDLFGLRLRKNLIFAVSDERFSRHKDRLPHSRGKPFRALSVAERKASVVLEDIIARGYNDISFYDDSRENLAAFRHLAKGFPDLVFKPHFIDPTWTQRLSEFVASGLVAKTLIGGEKSVRLLLRHHGEKSDQVESQLQSLQAGETIVLPHWPVSLARQDGRYKLLLDQTAATDTP